MPRRNLREDEKGISRNRKMNETDRVIVITTVYFCYWSAFKITSCVTSEYGD